MSLAVGEEACQICDGRMYSSVNDWTIVDCRLLDIIEHRVPISGGSFQAEFENEDIKCPRCQLQ
ncbi:hypothetical protein SERLA73DRAFT_180963 [Serpula lacrymans var. lacrymans S7.3]|uniref:Uncharacterized protein n=1 Tax=Serpula lacrymans var. lacrymans (strain S7.3) TaxID=936435 RepID=F8PWQ8_SERL3|nr:hypothetical protein SERLA73DRAFT_180963 [Serpula lacrymans var. lacrymans S7.3]